MGACRPAAGSLNDPILMGAIPAAVPVDFVSETVTQAPCVARLGEEFYGEARFRNDASLK
jgi:hypothetical protein